MRVRMLKAVLGQSKALEGHAYFSCGLMRSSNLEVHVVRTTFCLSCGSVLHKIVFYAVYYPISALDCRNKQVAPPPSAPVAMLIALSITSDPSPFFGGEAVSVRLPCM